jgi:hypothetical protein
MRALQTQQQKSQDLWWEPYRVFEDMTELLDSHVQELNNRSLMDNEEQGVGEKDLGTKLPFPQNLPFEYFRRRLKEPRHTSTFSYEWS